MAQKAARVREELGLDPSASMVDSVRSANAAVGLDNIGTLTDQVGRLLRETGIKPARGCAPGQQLSPGGGKLSFGTSTIAEEGPGSRPGTGSRPTSSCGVMTTQTNSKPLMSGLSMYERLQEQKRKDGVL